MDTLNDEILYSLYSEVNGKKTLLMNTYDRNKLDKNIEHYKQWCDSLAIVSVTETVSKLVNGLYEIKTKTWIVE